ncbi:MAG: 30S ribosomal protein S4 [Planctomycetes bacterium]|nr:30S ribosomal protein S4 [Planctomycetota bacterium]MBM4078164.1 30S ribosomal protein S4 [Planctomycetota bacterium]MBM4083375.1 30S ribosomal protein S4 [Planctomycetota bacterium]
MARLIRPACKICRREGVKLFLKGSRCDTVKCGLARREYPPGMHTWRRGKFSEYGQQLREKQKVKRYYGLLERQFRRYFAVAARSKGNTGETLLILLERRLDNVVYLCGFAHSRRHARQLLTHGHITVNGRRVDVPSYGVKAGDVVKPIQKEAMIKAIQSNLEANKSRKPPSWLDVKAAPPECSVRELPKRDEIQLAVQEQLIVELLSK